MLKGKGLILHEQVRSAYFLVQAMTKYGCGWVCYVLNDAFETYTRTDQETGIEEQGTNQVLDHYYVEDVRALSAGNIDVVVVNATEDEATYLNVHRAHLWKGDTILDPYLMIGSQVVKVVDVRPETITVPENDKHSALGFWPTDCLFGMTEMSPAKAALIHGLVMDARCRE